MNGTIGQHEAGDAMSVGNHSVTGGFWSLVAAVQAAWVPNLDITRLGTAVVVSWPNSGNLILQQNSDLQSGSWTTSRYSVTAANGANSITITTPAGNMFFRPKKP